jgi:MerR family transcriptional regulator, light-induced transcriptional regulator
MTKELFAGYRELPKVSPAAAEAYARESDKLLPQVQKALEAHPGIRELTGRAPAGMLRKNLQDHPKIMSLAFRVNSCELLVRTIAWEYSSCHSRGFSYDFFPVKFAAWEAAISTGLGEPVFRGEILAVYRWLARHHEDLVSLSRAGADSCASAPGEADELMWVFLAQLLKGDCQGCIDLAEQSIGSADDLRRFYLQVIWPALARIGYLWEQNQVSVAEEHVATAIVGRVMAALYPKISLSEVTRGGVVVSSGPNELHEVGARMLADFLEMDGWDVSYLGANSSALKLIESLKERQPFMVALSVATVFTLEKARQMIRMIQEDPQTRGIKIMVGGIAFSGLPQLWREVGADGFGADAGSAVSLCDQWWTARSSGPC